MKRVFSMWMAAALVALAVSSGPVWAQDPMADALQKIKTYAFGQSREPLTVVSDLVKAALASPDQRKAAAAQLAAFVGTDATLDAKQFVCRQLSICALPENVAAIAPLLTSADTSDMARYALEPIEGPEASQALIAALAGTSGAVKAGIINSLGVRRAPEAVAALTPLMTDADAAIAEPALTAIGKIGTADAVAALAGVKGTVAEALKPAWSDAYLLCADAYAKNGDAEGAAKLYKEMFAEDQPVRIRVAALQGMAKTGGDNCTDLILDQLSNSEVKIQGAAAALVREPGSEKATKSFAKAIEKLTPQGQVMLIAALGDRGDKAALKAVSQAVSSENADVRMAAFTAVGKLGDDSSVMLLAKAAASANGREREIVRNSLNTLKGDKVDATILNNFSKGDAEVQCELIRATAERGATAAVPALLKAAGGKDDAVSTAAFKSLGVLAGEKDLADLVAVVVALKNDALRQQAEESLVTVAKKAAEPAQRGKAILEALAKNPDAAARQSLLRAVGQVGDDGALDAVRAALTDGDRAIREAAVRSIAGWQTVTPLDDVLQIVKNEKDEVMRVLALRGYVRLLGMPCDRAAADTLARYKELLDLAAQPNDKKAVLAGLAEVGDPGALKLVEPFMADEALQAEAMAATVKIAQKIMGSNPEEAKAAATAVLGAAKDDNTRKAAQEVLDKIANPK